MRGGTSGGHFSPAQRFRNRFSKTGTGDKDMKGNGIMALAFAAACAAWGVAPDVDELATSHQWAQTKFGGIEITPAVSWLEVVANHNPVQKNGRFGKPLRVGEAEYPRGIYCHAVSKIAVHLPGPGKTFTAVAGADNNDNTAGGKGSVVFSVSAGGKTLFTSEVMHGGQAGAPVTVDLAGATEFTLDMGDGGDGISCDQGEWANAKVTLTDGGQLWLDELPMPGGPVVLDSAAPPFSFVYDGKPSSELLPTWKVRRVSTKLDNARTRHKVTYTDPQTRLELRCEAIEYGSFPTVEWTLYFKNTGTADTPILEKIQALDLGMERGDLGEFTLHHNVGSPANGNDYGPLETKLEANATKRLGAAGGRPTNTDMSYFNIESTVNDGLIAVVGWPGQWAAEFARDAGKGLHVTAGQELTHFKLLPGEELRSPLIVLQFWKGDWTRAQNIWRRWMMAHGMPRPGGKLPQPMTEGCSSRAYEEMIKADADSQIMFIDRYAEEGIKIDYWWMDAGWYVQQKGWPQVGTWEIDPKRFPEGFKPISAHAHEKDVKIVVWFEPERVAEGTWLTENHPEWILGGAKGGLLNLGDDTARAWLTGHVDKLITEQGIDLYRQDFNMDPLALWRANDAEDRQGVTEIRHVTGYLAYWDELLRRHPDLLIDSCASGGRRNDLETMRRAVPLWRSDYAFEPIGHQCMTYGISQWLPFHGTGTVACVDAPYYGGGLTPVQPYAFWSNAAPSINCGFDMRVKGIDYAALRKLFEAWRSVSDNYYGDFYPLTKYSMDKGDWIAWQFDRPEAGQGMVQAFRRTESIFTDAALPLSGLDPAAQYEVTGVGTNEKSNFSGTELMTKGLPVHMKERPEALVFSYKKRDN
jgi:alpha-galactosidase